MANGVLALLVIPGGVVLIVEEGLGSPVEALGGLGIIACAIPFYLSWRGLGPDSTMGMVGRAQIANIVVGVPAVIIVLFLVKLKAVDFVMLVMTLPFALNFKVLEMREALIRMNLPDRAGLAAAAYEARAAGSKPGGRHKDGAVDDVQYFRRDNSDTLIACVGTMGFEAMFRLDPTEADPKWEFLVPESPTWDFIHQEIYRAHRADRLDPNELPPDLPPLPEIPKGPFPKPEDYVLPEVPIHASRYPAVTEFLKARKDETVTVFVVLYEDGYETCCGDGEFHYFENAFLNREDAQRYMDRGQAALGPGWQQKVWFHLRTMTVKLAHEVFIFPDFKLELFDRYNVGDVLQVLEFCLPLKAYWAYNFDCDKPLKGMLAAWNEAGPWQWQLGVYIEAHSNEGVHVLVRDQPPVTGWYSRLSRSPSDRKFTALLEIKADSSVTQAEIDGIFRGLLARVNATNITYVQPFAPESLMDKPTREEQEKEMRELSDLFWLGAIGFKETDETVIKVLLDYKITIEEWNEFHARRRPVERSLEQVGTSGIFLRDLADYHGLPQPDLMERLRVIGAVKGEDGRFRLAGELAGSEVRPFTGITGRSPVQRPLQQAEVAGHRRAWLVDEVVQIRRLFEQAGAAGLSLDDLAKYLGRPPQEVLERLSEEGAVKGEDGRFRLPRRIRGEYG